MVWKQEKYGSARMMLSFTSLHWVNPVGVYFEINPVLHSKISIILVFLELVIQDSE